MKKLVYKSFQAQTSAASKEPSNPGTALNFNYPLFFQIRARRLNVISPQEALDQTRVRPSLNHSEIRSRPRKNTPPSSEPCGRPQCRPSCGGSSRRQCSSQAVGGRRATWPSCRSPASGALGDARASPPPWTARTEASPRCPGTYRWTPKECKYFFCVCDCQK